MKGNQVTVIDISTATILRIVAFIALIFLLIEAWQIVASVFLAIVIAAALEPSLRWFESKKIKRIYSVPVIYLVAFALVVGTFYAVIPGLFFEIRDLSQDLPERIDSFVDNTFAGTVLEGVIPNVQDMFSNVEDRLGGLGDNLFSFATTIFGGVVSMIFIVVASFWLCLDRREVNRFLTSFTPAVYRDYIGNLWGRIQRRLGHWMQAQFIIAVLMGVAVYVLLSILGSPYALTLGVVAGFLEVIPFIGPLIAGALILGLVAVDSVVKGLIAVVIYVLFQQFEQNVIVPTIMSKVVGSNPLVILVAALIGAELLGFWGIVLAIPIVAVVSEILRDIKKQTPEK